MWIGVISADALPPGDYAQVDVDGVIVAVFNVDGQYLAIEDVCTHDGGGLAGGAIEDNCIVCPRHGARFCLKTGTALTPPAYEAVNTYRTRIHEGMIEVSADESAS
jgi:3-phenylpropionate/trans-cinnamate dioxygenase ferredoxin component